MTRLRLRAHTHSVTHPHIWAGMWERTVSISSAGKTFSVTGWKVGWAVGPEHLIRCLVRNVIIISAAQVTCGISFLRLSQCPWRFLLSGHCQPVGVLFRLHAYAGKLGKQASRQSAEALATSRISYRHV